MTNANSQNLKVVVYCVTIESLSTALIVKSYCPLSNVLPVPYVIVRVSALKLVNQPEFCTAASFPVPVSLSE